MWKAAIIFLLVYAGLVTIKRYRPAIVWCGIAAALAVGAVEFGEIAGGLKLNVLGIFFGSLVLAELFIYSKLPEAISDNLINRSSNLGAAFLLIIVFASFISIFIDNVVTVLIVAPIALHLTRKAGVSPVPVIVGLAISSNLQGMAILIGDTPSMILAARMKMNFLDFFVYTCDSQPGYRWGIFWFVQLGALAGVAVLYAFFRGMKQKPARIPVTRVKTWVPLWLIVITIVLLSCASFIDRDFRWFGGTACMLVGVIGYVWYRFHGTEGSLSLLRRLHWGTLAFLAGIFVLVTMLECRGVVDALVGRMEALSGSNPFIIYTAVVWFSVLVSAFIDNIPYITAMLPVVIGFSDSISLPPEMLVFGVLVGACLGGNITPIGAAANVVAVGILEKERSHVSFGSFVRIGLPFTLAATIVSYIALWFAYR